MLKSALIAKFSKETSPKKKLSVKGKPKNATATLHKQKSQKLTQDKLSRSKFNKEIVGLAESKEKIVKKQLPVKRKPKYAPTTLQKQKPHSHIEKAVAISKLDEQIVELAKSFRINLGSVKTGIEGLIKFTTENPKLKQKLFNDEKISIFLQINVIKMPKIYPRIVRIPLKHSIWTPDSEICLIVADVKGIPNKNHEEHLEYYDKLLRQQGVQCINKVMTFHEFRTDYETFESKNRLVELYDVFLVDGKISGKTVSKCGKIFYQKRKIPAPVRLKASKLKNHIEQTLRKTPLYIHSNGDSFMVKIGHSEMDPNKVAENALYVVQGLEKEFPGGFGNIRNLNLQTYRGISIPIYTTLKNQNQVDISKNMKEIKVAEPVTGELTTRLNAKVSVLPTGEVTVHKLNSETELQDASPQVASPKKRSNPNNENPKKKRKMK